MNAHSNGSRDARESARARERREARACCERIQFVIAIPHFNFNLFIYTRTDNYRRTKLSLYHRTGRSTESACDSETRHSTLYNQHVQAAGTCIYHHVTRQSPVAAHAPGHRDQRTCQPGRRPAPQTPAPQTPTACQGDPSARTIGGGRWSRLSRAASVCCFLGL